MAYSKQTWTDNTTQVNAARLGHIEDGIFAAQAAADAAATAAASALATAAAVSPTVLWNKATSTWGDRPALPSRAFFLSTDDPAAPTPSDIDIVAGDVWLRHPDAV